MNEAQGGPGTGDNVQRKILPRMRRVASPEDVAVLRERLTAARLMNGFSVDQAQKRFGGDEFKIGLIESGQQPFPKWHRFLSKAAEVYSVSLDFLYGQSPNAETDAVISERFAIMRGFEAMLAQQAKATSGAFLHYLSSQDKLCKSQYQAIVDAVDKQSDCIAAMRKHGFDEIRGGAKVLSTLSAIEKAILPVRQALAAQNEIEAYCKNLALGKVGPISYLTSEYWAEPNTP